MRKNDLFNFIKSLTPVEYRYVKREFKALSSSKTDNLKILEFMRKQDVYDETKLKLKFKGESFIKQFETKKYYLYNSIMKSMVSYNNNRFSNEYGYLSLEILLEKGFYAQAYEKLNRLKKKIECEHDYFKAIQLLEFENKLSFFFDKIDKQELSMRANSLTARYQNYFLVKNLYFRMNILIRKSTFIRSDLQKKEMESILTDIPNLNEGCQEGELTRLIIHDILFLYYASMSDWETAKGQLYKQLNLINSGTLKQEDKVHYLVNNLNRRLLCSISQGEFDESRYILNDVYFLINEFNLDKDDMYSQMAYSTRFYEFVLFSKSGDEDKIMEITIYLEDKLKEEEFLKTMGSRFMNLVQFEMAKAYFRIGKFKVASQWNYKVMYATKELPYCNDLHTFSSILNLVINYELSDFNLWDSDCNALKRYLKNNDRMYTFEAYFLKFALNTLPEATLNDFQLFQQAINEILSDPYSKAVTNYFDFKHWATIKVAQG